jgi:hypothetical protein
MKKTKIISPEKEEIINFNGAVYSTKFINYQDTGEIISISSSIESENFLEIDIELISNFVTGNKNFHKYNIDYFKKIKLGVLKDTDELDTLVKFDYIYYKIPENNDFHDICINHDANNKEWIVSLSEVLNKHTLEDFNFYVVFKNNKNFLLSSYTVNAENLIKEKNIKFKFLSNDEIDFNKIEILTYKNYNHYSVKELYVECYQNN